MKNYEINGYDPTPVADAHLHHTIDIPAEDTLKAFRAIIDHMNYDRVLLAALTSHSPIENVLSLYCKANLAPVAYSSASLNHYYDGRDTAEYFLSEIKKYRAMGCDGIKMLEGKPSVHRLLHTKNLADKVYEPFFAYAEENAIPILLHLGDPPSFWDPAQMTQYEIDRGWAVGSDEPTLEELRGEVAAVLRKFPGLVLTLAHFYFMENELDRLERMFSDYKNLSIDLTPGKHFDWLCTHPTEATAFFERHRDRILLGTDTYNNLVIDVESYVSPRLRMVRGALEGREEYSVYGRPYRPFGVNVETRDCIYRRNFTRIYGESPRPLDYERIAAECRLVAAERVLSDAEQARLDTVSVFFDSKK